MKCDNEYPEPPLHHPQLNREFVGADVLEQQFAILLFRLHQNINLLDLNLGLSIRYMENPNDVDRSHTWLANSTLASKVEKFLELVGRDKKSAPELAAWHDAARKARCDRNVFTHAYWDFLPLDVETPIHLQTTPWQSKEVVADIPRKMSLADFEIFVAKVEDVFERFTKLRGKLNV